MGIQGASHKIRLPSQSENGPWTGSMLETDNKNIFVRMTQTKWDKDKVIIYRLLSEFESANDEPVLFCHKHLEQDRGFLIHMTMTYDWMKLFSRVSILH